MCWKSEISEFYKVKCEEQFFSWRSIKDMTFGLDSVVKALHEIKSELKPFVRKIQLTEFPDEERQSANLTFEEKFSGKTSFVVTLDMNSSYVTISTRHAEKYRTYYLRLDKQQSLNSKVIIDEFMVFFRSTRYVNED